MEHKAHAGIDADVRQGSRSHRNSRTPCPAPLQASGKPHSARAASASLDVGVEAFRVSEISVVPPCEALLELCVSSYHDSTS